MSELPIHITEALQKRITSTDVPERQDQLHKFDTDMVTVLPSDITLVNESNIKHHVGTCYQIYLGTHEHLQKFDTPLQVQAFEELGGQIESIAVHICHFAPIVLIYAKQVTVQNMTPHFIEKDSGYSDLGKDIQNKLINLFAEKDYHMLKLGVANELAPKSELTIREILFYQN